MLRPLFFSILLLLPLTAAAQTRIDLGLAMGQQAYESSADNPRVLTSAEVLFTRGALGAQLATEYADLSEVDGPLIATHVDFLYRQRFDERSTLSFGAGPSFISVGSTVSEWTWNAEVDVTYAIGRTEIFGRVRYYDFSISSFRAGESGPNGPALYVGARFAVRR